MGSDQNDHMAQIGRTIGVESPPVIEVKRWLSDPKYAPNLPLIDVSQAAPTDPPPIEMRQKMAEFVLDYNDVHTYGPVLGDQNLRENLAQHWAKIYNNNTINYENIAITSGCNQAFCATIASITNEGDEIILPKPWYFNHKMWLEMQGLFPIALECDENCVPNIAQVQTLITHKTRAIVLVSPNNPTGTIYCDDLLNHFFEICNHYKIKLILDETYKDFHKQAQIPHTLFTHHNWYETLISLYSFSKTYRLTGHRVGAIIAGPSLLAEIEKFLDTMTVCPSQLGQFSANWGLLNLEQWVAQQRNEILKRAKHFQHSFLSLKEIGWKLKGCGAYFAFVEHPFLESSDKIAPQILRDAGVLLMPGSMFYPKDDPNGPRHFRIAFANINQQDISELMKRLENLTYPLADISKHA